MYTFWFKTRFIALLLIYMHICGQVNGCHYTTNQVTIDMNWYNNDTNADLYVPADIVIDSNLNQYLLYSYSGSDQDAFITRILPNGTHQWSKRYTSFEIIDETGTMHVSNNGSLLRIIGRTSNSL